MPDMPVMPVIVSSRLRLNSQNARELCVWEVMLASTRQPGRSVFRASSALPSLNTPTCRFFGTTRHVNRQFTLSYSRDKNHDSNNRNARRRDAPTKGRLSFTRNEQARPRLKFIDVLKGQLDALKLELNGTPIGQDLESKGKFKDVWKAFTSAIFAPGDQSSTQPLVLARRKEHQALRDAWFERGVNGLNDRIRYAFYDHITTARFTPSDIRNQKNLADLRYPTEWYPATRTMHRTIHLHVGPTNSGKTYHALQRLEQADSGVYAGPLRLLAHEVYTRLNAKGKNCMLITGEEKRAPSDDSLTSDLTSCTVEMMPLNKDVDVAVIDEIQMIGNAERGWAWTQAVLGVKAREVHLCGETRTVPLIRELCASIGEKLVIHEYERLSPLHMADRSLRGDLKKLRKGDCIVSFSVMGIHALRKQIEQSTGRKVATVYGSLPPETRAQQARLFNDPDNDYDYLVASDAIGMGLNLSIKRVIFESSAKFNGFRQSTLAVPDIKQIAGRAGRFKSAYQANKASEEAVAQSLAEVKGESEPGKETIIEAPVAASPSQDVQTSTDAVETEKNLDAAKEPTTSEDSTLGLVTTLEDFDFPVIAKAMTTEPEPIRSAGIFPPAAIVESFASYFPPGTPFSYILMRLHELSQMHSRFHLCGLKDQLWIADLIEPIQGLTVTDRNILCACPASKTDKDLNKRLIPALARCIEQQSGGALFDIEEMPLETLELEMSPSRDYLRQLEQLHKAVVAYLWLSYRFAGIFSTRPLAFHVKGLVEEKIEHVLHQFSFTENQRRKIKAAREKALMEDFRRESLLDVEGEDQEATEDTDQQTSVIAGGDSFAGETDLEIMDAAERESNDESAQVVDSDDLAPKTT
ncbi:P-loop containing nucleoside triphosphate hydrolase protein [Aureobasidium subglaciale]|nr:P-loop containing nucleoside triphosphate hydrolase protein [Aureobasidium subglaciale]KAI5231201.1 P-loop containing nucleoside triphosphate hydrolase protein [Aureobasidium subglaciale]KAI5234108.1 P-loop containing nucleoside triphosphate hydrolase protein [Aureobasidium subglaciale]KAI5267526.1 P-loop containing nucleoside triphosphate hydrolase protein [Aureobasidium subglaciale]